MCDQLPGACKCLLLCGMRLQPLTVSSPVRRQTGNPGHGASVALSCCLASLLLACTNNAENSGEPSDSFWVVSAWFLFVPRVESRFVDWKDSVAAGLLSEQMKKTSSGVKGNLFQRDVMFWYGTMGCNESQVTK